jgi:ubiquinone/menaquinone biosynthesis C-methylase UbiE
VSARKLALAGGSAVLGVALWWRYNPSACPYSQRFWVELPHPIITRERLLEVLAPQPGERILEVGPGTGYYTLDVAEWVGDDGTVDIFDLQQEMLDHTMRRARERGLGGITPTRGDARCLHYPDESFDADYLVTVLGEIPDQAAAVRELARVLKPGGRIGITDVVAEDRPMPDERAERGSYVGCVAGALSQGEYVAGLEAAGFSDVSVEFTHRVADGMHSAIVRGVKAP